MSPILGQFRGYWPGLWAALLAAAPTPAWAEAVSIDHRPGYRPAGGPERPGGGRRGARHCRSLWALAEQRKPVASSAICASTGARTRSAVGERDALLGAAREALVVWGRDGSGPFSYGGGEEMLDSCLKGADALALSTALDGLSDRGQAFKLPVADASGRKLMARGRAVGSMAAVWLEEQSAASVSADFRAILDALPVPVWLRDKGLALTWGNHAFLASAGAADSGRGAHPAGRHRQERARPGGDGPQPEHDCRGQGALPWWAASAAP